MTTETQPEQPILSDEEENLEEVGVQPDPRRMAYKSVLVAVVIGILAISALWMFVIRQEGSPVYEAPVTEPDVQVHEDSVAKALPAAKADPVVESISRKLASMSGQIDSYIAGLIILAAAPCTAMVFVWSHLSKGEPHFTLSQVALNDVIMIFAFAPSSACCLACRPSPCRGIPCCCRCWSISWCRW